MMNLPHRPCGLARIREAIYGVWWWCCSSMTMTTITTMMTTMTMEKKAMRMRRKKRKRKTARMRKRKRILQIPQSGKTSVDAATYVPLLVQETAVEMAEEAAGQAADWAAAQQWRQLEKAQAQLTKVIGTVDATVKPQAKALQKLLNKSSFRKLSSSAPATTTKILELISKTGAGKKVCKTLEKVGVELKQIEDKGTAPLLQKLLDSQLEARTGYSSGQLLRIFRVTAIQMARDSRELKKLQAYLEKLQDTVNENNWDDVADNFSCFYALQKHLQGERSKQVFRIIWKNQELRECALLIVDEIIFCHVSFFWYLLLFRLVWISSHRNSTPC